MDIKTIKKAQLVANNTSHLAKSLSTSVITSAPRALSDRLVEFSLALAGCMFSVDLTEHIDLSMEDLGELIPSVQP